MNLLSSPKLRLLLAGLALKAVLLLLVLQAGAARAQVGMLQLGGAAPLSVLYPTTAVASTRSFGPFELAVAMDAAPVAGNGRLIVLSHGSGGDTLSLSTLASTLVRAGFVVAQPLHQGDNWQDARDLGPVAFERRPREISQAIDRVAAEPRLAAVLRLDRVGVFGMSAGGLTGLSLAGGQWSEALLRQHCQDHGQDDAGFCLFGVRSAQDAAERAASYRRPAAPGAERLRGGPQVSDARVAAVALAVPVAAIFSDDSLAAIRIPVGVVEADADEVLRPAFHSTRLLKLCSACVALDRMEGAGHFDTLSPWPPAVAQNLARMPGGARHDSVDEARRLRAYTAVAGFFTARLLP